MSITKMNVIDIMSEAVKGQVNTDNDLIDDIADDIKDTVEKCSEMSIPFKYTAEMIPVIFDEASQSYFVEYDMLRKLIECGNEDTVEIITKYGTIGFTPKKEVEQAPVVPEENEDDVEPVTEEEPEKDDEEKEIEESAFDTGYPYLAQCRERDALVQVILANMPHDPNKCDKEECCCPSLPEMTLENTYIVIESEDEIGSYIDEVCESAKTGGVALKNGKAKLKKADAVFKNLKNHGLKVVKKQSKKSK